MDAFECVVQLLSVCDHHVCYLRVLPLCFIAVSPSLSPVVTHKGILYLPSVLFELFKLPILCLLNSHTLNVMFLR